MYSKNIKLVGLLLFISGITRGQNYFSDSYKPGDKLYVYTRDGLSLREQPDPKGKLIIVASYGDELIVLADDKPKVSFTSSNIPGTWVKVKHKDQSGYMFNGFLSRLTYQEVFLLSRLAYPEFFVNKKCDYKIDNTTCEVDENASLAIKKEGSYYSIIYGSAD